MIFITISAREWCYSGVSNMVQPWWIQHDSVMPWCSRGGSNSAYRDDVEHEIARLHIYIYVCVCVCVCIYIYIYVYIGAQHAAPPCHDPQLPRPHQQAAVTGAGNRRGGGGARVSRVRARGVCIRGARRHCGCREGARGGLEPRVSDLPVYSGLATPPRGKFRDPKIGVP